MKQHSPDHSAVFAFACSVKGANWGEEIINARTRGRAKREYHLSVTDAWPDVPFIAIRARKIGAPHTTADFVRNAEYRGLPNVRCGQRVKVGDARGVIVGHNSSANFDVLFDDDSPRYAGQTLNCHPGEVKIHETTSQNHMTKARKTTRKKGRTAAPCLPDFAKPEPHVTGSASNSEVNHLRSLLDDANGKLHILQSMMSEAGFPMRIKFGEDLHGNTEWVRVRPECQLRDVLRRLAEQNAELSQMHQSAKAFRPSDDRTPCGL